MKFLILVFLSVFSFGCASVVVPTSLSGTARLTDNEVAILWPSSIVSLFSYNDQDLTEAGINSPVIRDVPGIKRLKFSSYAAKLYKDIGDHKKGDYVSLYIDTTVDMKAGYSYTLEFVGGNDLAYDVNSKLCIYEEQHNAEGSSVSSNGAIRKQSDNAKLVNCTPGELVKLEVVEYGLGDLFKDLTK